MTSLQNLLARLRADLAAATPGPLKVDDDLPTVVLDARAARGGDALTTPKPERKRWKAPEPDPRAQRLDGLRKLATVLGATNGTDARAEAGRAASSDSPLSRGRGGSDA